MSWINEEHIQTNWNDMEIFRNELSELNKVIELNGLHQLNQLCKTSKFDELNEPNELHKINELNKLHKINELKKLNKRNEQNEPTGLNMQYDVLVNTYRPRPFVLQISNLQVQLIFKLIDQLHVC